VTLSVYRSSNNSNDDDNNNVLLVVMITIAKLYESEKEEERGLIQVEEYTGKSNQHNNIQLSLWSRLIIEQTIALSASQEISRLV
jgi:hypothetical protein